ncbi:MAG: addiction module protein [Thermoanaerobaculia bacterium]
MDRDAEALLKEVLLLSEADRVYLAEALLASLDTEEAADVEAAWRQEIAIRVAAVDAGEVETVPWEKVRDQLFARMRERRAD